MIPEHIKLGIDCKNNFAIDYIYDTTKKENIKKIKDAAKTATKIWVCSDEDREGHAIAEEVVDLLKQYKNKIVRTTFNEITDKAIKDAFKNPTGFNKDMAMAAETRGVLDKLVGYRTSNIVLSKLGAPSAGRVQSALLRILSDKEENIQKFKSSKYYEVFVDYKKGQSNLSAKLFQVKDKKAERLSDKSEAEAIIKNCGENDYFVEKINEKEKSIEPKLPMTTAALQQLASNVLGWAPSRTQKNAQSLYESGKITYIRTDAVRFAPEFLDMAKPFIEKNYGKEYYRGLKVPEEKNKNAQNAHESIRPTNLEDTPTKIANLLDADQSKLYKLIYNYSLAALFVPAKVKDTDVIIKNGDYHFRTSGRVIIYESFLCLTNEIDTAKKLPVFKVDEKINDKETYFLEKETQPPQRYSEAGLVKIMQDSGIGRPSTYAPTIETLKKREYIKIEKKAVYVTELGLKLNSALKKYFDGFFEPKYTAEMESQLDKISNGELTELVFLNTFWKNFEPVVLQAARTMNKEKPKAEVIDGEVCPICGKPLCIRTSKTGSKFAACTGFPKCHYTAFIDSDGNIKKEVQKSTAEKTNIKCPKCGKGVLVKRTSKTGETFYGCSNFIKGCKCTISEEDFNEKYRTK